MEYIKIDERDLRLDTFTNSSPIVRMKMTHLPTGHTAKATGISHHKLKELLMDKIEIKVVLDGLR